MSDVGGPLCETETLSLTEWTARAARYLDRVERFVGPHEQRTRAGVKHPVWDFLFTYYNLKPRHLRRWHPGYGVVLDAGDNYLDRSGYGRRRQGVGVTETYLAARLDTIGFVARLLSATAGRPAQLNCFGMHEWAMVYKSRSVRHEHVPLRLGPAGTDAVVESIPLRCSHFDAYRFFTPEAAPRNVGTPTRATQVDIEQPGCLHAAMDLYKWCAKLGPLVNSDLLADCLELAAAARELDMAASPYDLRDFGYAPIAVETAAGRAEYVRHQQALAKRAAPLRQNLLRECERLLAAGGRR